VDFPEEFARNVALLKDETASLEAVKAADDFVWEASRSFGQVLEPKYNLNSCLFQQLVVKGDLLTAERVRGAKKHRRRSTTRSYSKQSKLSCCCYAQT